MQDTHGDTQKQICQAVTGFVAAIVIGIVTWGLISIVHPAIWLIAFILMLGVALLVVSRICSRPKASYRAGATPAPSARPAPVDARTTAAVSKPVPPQPAPEVEPAPAKPAAAQAAPGAASASESAEPVIAEPASEPAPLPERTAAETVAAAPPPKAGPPPADPSTEEAADRPDISTDTAPPTLSAARDGKPDNLKEIKGVGPKLEALLNRLGFYHFDQIAGWSEAEIDWVDSKMEGFRGRIRRDDWMAQARTLAAGGKTEFADKVKKGGVY